MVMLCVLDYYFIYSIIFLNKTRRKECAILMISFTTENKTVNVFPSNEPDKPVVYLNTFNHEGEKVFQQLQASNCPDFTLVEISNLEWNHNMAPWSIPPIFENSTTCSGGANDYIKLLLEKIIPQAEKKISGKPAWRGIAGYSLAGLFAIYTIYQTDVFSHIASMSGSLWFPGIKEYIFSNAVKIKPNHLYFSLGDRECKTRNKFLKCVQQNTEEIVQFYKDQGIDTIFQMNPGNHYKNSVERSAAGIIWLLNK